MTKEIKNRWYHCYENDAGKKHGEYKAYRANGELKVHCHYNNGKLHGDYKSYGKNGQLWEHCHYKNDELHGEYKAYCEDVQLWVNIYYVNDDEVHDFIEEDSEFIRTCLYMTHGAPWLT